MISATWVRRADEVHESEKFSECLRNVCAHDMMETINSKLGLKASVLERDRWFRLIKHVHQWMCFVSLRLDELNHSIMTNAMVKSFLLSKNPICCALTLERKASSTLGHNCPRSREFSRISNRFQGRLHKTTYSTSPSWSRKSSWRSDV